MWDVFISYASEDRSVAASLAAELKSRGLQVWFDVFALKVGDSLRRSIDNGLSQSRFGAVILSHAFFRKDWPQRELNGLFSIETAGRKVLLPVWHGLTIFDVRAYSPLLSDLIGASTDDGIATVANRLADAMQTAGEPWKPDPDRNTSPQTPAGFAVRVLAGPDQGDVFPLRRTRMIVGRSTAADIRLSESAASRSHFALVWDVAKTAYVVEDWHHSTQMQLNGTVVAAGTRRVLQVGDELRLGATVMRIELG